MRRQGRELIAPLPRSGEQRERVDQARTDERLQQLRQRRAIAWVMLGVGVALGILLLEAPFVEQGRLWLLQPIFLVVGMLLLVRYLARDSDAASWWRRRR